MRSHPFTNNMLHVLVTLLLAIVTGISGAWVFTYYFSYTWKEAAVQSTVITLLWITGLYYSWYIFLYVKVFQAKAVVGIFLQILSVFTMYAVLTSFHCIEPDDFIRSAPFLFLLGFLCWVIVMQWYPMAGKEEESTEELFQEPDTFPEESREPALQTISVKEGTHIHIIPVETIFYIQACGDYVNIFTPEGQFIKEQTMKSLEAALPVTFIRVHRSTIINSTHLSRIELFGKDSYRIQLKNGVSIKASLSGYKTLKSRLNL
ncbi:MAG: LytTR family transcriptional regulator DNA-binding domain-containing protein [Tannerellaceae bacterium]|nr:LytTR family transcriptional regulator DNA-binding domain-containing protein [Tannerellaceae bacterium]